ncbi:MAG: hypothetical protein IPI85_16845 [Dehalococcoidia bacterium]|nr:hypothetical protein [Dehalococcoidia bacterium]
MGIRRYDGDARRLNDAQLVALWPQPPRLNWRRLPRVLEEIALNYDYGQESQADPDLATTWLGLGTRPSSSATDYTENLTPSEKLAREQFEYTKQQNALKMALGGSSSSGSKISSSSTRSSSSGGGGSTSNYADDLAYLQAKTDATASLAQQEFDLKKQLMLLQFDLDNDPNNPKLLLQQQQLAEEKRQLDATLFPAQQVRSGRPPTPTSQDYLGLRGQPRRRGRP